MNDFERLNRERKISRMIAVLSTRATMDGRSLTSTLDRLLPAGRERLDELANPGHPASADTWEALRLACVRRDEIAGCVDRHEWTATADAGRS